MNNLSVDCDCDAHPEPPRMGDIGILASLDPVALDQACVDLVYASPDEGKVHLIERMESRHGIHTLEHAEAIGIGSQPAVRVGRSGQIAEAARPVEDIPVPWGCLFFARGGTEPSARGVPARAFVHKMFIKSPEACFLSGELSLYLLSCKVLRRRLSARDQKGTPVKIRDYSRSCKPRCVPHTL